MTPEEEKRLLETIKGLRIGMAFIAVALLLGLLAIFVTHG